MSQVGEDVVTGTRAAEGQVPLLKQTRRRQGKQEDRRETAVGEAKNKKNQMQSNARVAEKLQIIIFAL